MRAIDVLIWLPSAALAAAAVLVLFASPGIAGPVRRSSKVRNSNWNDSPYGMNCFHPNGPAPHGHLVHFTPENMARLREGNVRWVRLMVDWRYCEPRPGRYYWDSLDRVVGMLNREKIGISACLYEQPDWAEVGQTDWRVRPEYWERFGRAVARRFRDRIAAYEIYNERPTGAWPRVAERRADLYVPVLKAAYRGIKSGDPKALVLMTGLWEFPMYYLEDMYRAGAKGCFDAVNIHYYLRMSRDPRYMDPFRGDLRLVLKQVDYVTRKYGDSGVPVWFTEFGWPATAESQAFPVGDQKMAEYLAYFYRVCADSGLVEKVFWYVYYLSDGMALWHQGRDRKRPAFHTHLDFSRRHPTWGNLPVKALGPVPGPARGAAKVPNGDFEGSSSWRARAGGRFEYRSGRAAHGGRYLHLACERPGTVVEGQSFPLEGGRAYELTGFVRMKGGLENERYAHAMIRIELLGEGERPLGFIGPRMGEAGDDRSTNYYVSDTDGKWYEVHYNIFAPGNVRSGRVLLAMGHPDVPRGEADFDYIQVKPLDLAKYD